MRRIRAFASLLLLAISPTFLYPQNALPQPTSQVQNPSEKDYAFSYDDMLRLIDGIESGKLESTCTFEESERIKHFIAFLAKEGALPDNSEESLSLDNDIEELLYGEENIYQNAFSFATSDDYRYVILPAIFNERSETILCKSWFKKQWNQVKHFVKKHKKELIVGAAVVVAAATVVVVVAAAGAAASSAAAAGAAGAAGAATSSDHHSHKKDAEKSPSSDDLPAEAPTTLKSAIDHQIASFKEDIVQNQLLEPSDPSTQEGFSWEEEARDLGSLFAHLSYNDLHNQLSDHPNLAQEISEINAKYTFAAPGGNCIIGHPEIDRKFSTDHSYLFLNPAQEGNFTSLAYQLRGEKALDCGYYQLAVQDLGKAIETNPTNPIPYLERGVAHFSLGQYDQSIEDYKQYTVQAQSNSVSFSEFGLGFATGLPKGICESGEGIWLFLTDFATHPIQTAKQMADSVSTLVDLVRTDEWGVVAEALTPELHQLVTQWDALPSHQRGELAGYAFGKHGTDIFVPGSLAKIASKSMKSAQELAALCKNIRTTQETLLLETAANIGNPAKIAEIIEAGQKTAFIAEELGVSAGEMGQLKQAGKLRATLVNNYEHLTPSLQESFELHKKAREALKPYLKKPLPESQVRELIHASGIQTFPRPAGIPENYLVMISGKGAGIEYVHPRNEHIRIRIMPGKPHSPNLHQQKPYVIQQKDGKAIDKFGNYVSTEAPEAHIPLEDFTCLIKE